MRYRAICPSIFRSLLRNLVLPYPALYGSEPEPQDRDRRDGDDRDRIQRGGDGQHTASNSIPIIAISPIDRKSTRLNSSHTVTSYAVFCLNIKTNVRIPFRVSRQTLLGVLT